MLFPESPALRVIARTSTFAFKGKVQDIRGIAESLGVDNVLEGSVRTAGQRIRINTQLISAHDGAQLWSKRYDRQLIDVFAIQDEISHAIANELKVSLTPHKLVKAPTAHFAAYEAVLEGRYHFLRFDPKDQAKALACFERAVAIDPSYAAAHVGIALNHWGQMVVGMADPRQAMQRSVVAAREALRLDPDNSDGHHILGSYCALHDFDWAKAGYHFDRSLELNPHSLWAYHCKTIYFLSPLGRYEEALECNDLALAVDPLSLPLLANRALTLECLHRESEEAQVLERLTHMDPNFVGGQWPLVRFRIRQGRIAEAVELAERLVHTAGRWGMTLGALGAAYAAAGRADEARAVIAELALEHNRESRAFYSFLDRRRTGRSRRCFPLGHRKHRAPRSDHAELRVEFQLRRSARRSPLCWTAANAQGRGPKARFSQSRSLTPCGLPSPVQASQVLRASYPCLPPKRLFPSEILRSPGLRLWLYRTGVKYPMR